MNNQDQGKNHSSGHDSHEIHVCNKCGWPFPKPHPSARHRRAHKKICGTIEGYKLADTGETAHEVASDEEHHSDENNKAPSPKTVAGTHENTSGGIERVPSRSEEEVFSDAVTEFPESGFNTARGNEKAAVKFPELDRNATLSFKDCIDTDVSQTPRNSTDGKQIPDAGVQDDMPSQSGGAQEHLDQAVDSRDLHTNDRDGSASISKSVTDDTSRKQTEENKNATSYITIPASSLTTFGQETEVKRSQVINSVAKIGDVISSSELDAETSEMESKSTERLEITSVAVPVLAGQEDDAKVIEGGSVDGNMKDDVFRNESEDKASDVASRSEKRLEVTGETVLIGANVQLKEESTDILLNKMSMGEHVKLESSVKEDTVVTLEKNLMTVPVSQSDYGSVASETTLKFDEKEDIPLDTELADQVFHEKKEFRDVFTAVMPKTGSTGYTDPLVDATHTKTDSTKSTESLSSANASISYRKEEETESMNVISVPNDIPIVENAEIMLESYKDYKDCGLVKSQGFALLASGELIKDTDDGIKGPVPKENVISFPMRQTIDGNKPCGSDMDVVEDVCKHGDKESECNVLEAHVEGEADLPKSSTVSGKLEAFSDDELQPHGISDVLPQAGLSDTSGEVLTDLNSTVALLDTKITQIKTVDGTGRTSDLGNVDTGEHAAAGMDNSRSVGEFCIEKLTSSETVADHSKYHADPTSTLLKADNGSGDKKGKTGNFDVDEAEIGKGLEVKIFSKNASNTNFASESTCYFPTITGSVTDDVVESIGTRSTHLDGAPEKSDDFEEPESNSNNRRQGSGAIEVSKDSKLDHGRQDEFQETSVNEIKESLHYPLDTEPISKSSAPVVVKNTREYEGDVAVIRSMSLQGSNADISVKNQQDTSAPDVLVETMSQTDSLDAIWGSVSAQSDGLTVIDVETVPPTDRQIFVDGEKAEPKQSKSLTEEQEAVKTDLLQRPSSMAFNGPRDGEEIAAASEAQTIQNLQQHKAASAEAGSYPSGKAKNEEIIAKVTNWNVKQHIPLKDLLGEANAESKQKPQNQKESAVVEEEKEGASTNNGSAAMKISSILGPEAPVAEPDKMETGKEWNSPAKYPADIKREKRKVKGRPHWAQFVCCSSVN